MNETELISCPACKHLLRVPQDWLGTTVQCPECQAKFTAPRRDGDKLTEPVLIAGGAPPTPAGKRRIDRMLLLPAFGLMLVGFASAAINGWYSIRYLQDPAAAERDSINSLKMMYGENQLGDQKVEDVAAKWAPTIRVIVIVAAVAGATVFLGGLAIVRGKSYRLAQFGCFLAAINLPHLCCVPGAVCAIWAILLMNSEEGSQHFA